MNNPDPSSYFQHLPEAWYKDDQELKKSKEYKDELERLQFAAFDNIIRRAGEGEVAAVEWLEKRGFLELPKLND